MVSVIAAPGRIRSGGSRARSVDAGIVPDATLHLGHQRDHVVGAPAVVGLDEVGVLGRHLGRTRRAGPCSPAASMRRPAESSGGLVNTEPAFGPPGWCSRRQRTISSISAVGAGRRRPACSPTRPTRRPATARSRSAGRTAPSRSAATHPSSPLARSQTRTLRTDGGHVRAVAAGVHPHRAADRSGHADRPLEAGQPGRGVRRATTGQRRRPAGADASPSAADVARSRRVEGLAEHAPRRRRSRRRPRAGSSPCRPPAPSTPRARDERRGRASSSSRLVVEPDERPRPRHRRGRS